MGWPKDVSEVRIALRKVEGRKVAAGMSVEEAEGERWGVSKGSACEGWRVGSGNSEGAKGFVIKIDDKGVEIVEKK